ncbi:BMP family lipoprotein [Paenibacillus agricola]|uniref:BMP family ABC transporter substrate-binding protein n=1 Tax=Paenibacillus agricola TaxID=2716264 RepID=A0ABX0J9Z4_9BACL|nr:BMP family ABC transporter substrate-binding protein [Paenibacillus agricola]NHN31692.1 BMP family ABC transporter substrate-binding protein [Paenibacillus agricola]
MLAVLGGWRFITLALVVALLAAGCSTTTGGMQQKNKMKIGVMLSDVGLGDQSFSDAAFQGLIKARGELGIQFDYREISETKTYDVGIEQLVQAGNDLIVALGFMSQESLEKVAAKYPEQTFLLIDSVSELKNVHSLTFKEDEGSFLIGAVTGMKSKTGKVGFIGGMDAPVIRNFYNGYVQGVKSVKPDTQVLLSFAEDFGNADKGAELARKMIAEGADVIYPAAGLTGVGSLKEAEASGVLAFGVDSDQFTAAEKAVVSSMLKNVDEGIFQVANMWTRTGKLEQQHMVLGLKENGVGLAPIRVVKLSDDEQRKLDGLKQQLIEGKIMLTVN